MNEATQNCLFCKMSRGEIPVPKVFENERFFCIRDIQPQAKTHLLVIPKEHLPSLREAFAEGGPARNELLGELFQVGTRIARQQGILESGFRTVLNTGNHAGQTVHHIHLHLLGGESLKGGFGS